MLLYRFNTKRADDIDIPRISEENKDIEALLVIVEGREDALLLLHNDFLKKFHRDDEILVDDTYLSPTWQADCYTVTQLTGRNPVSFYYNTDYKMTFHRGQCINIDTISKIEKQLQAARNYKRKFEVKVHSL